MTTPFVKLDAIGGVQVALEIDNDDQYFLVIGFSNLNLSFKSINNDKHSSLDAGIAILAQVNGVGAKSQLHQQTLYDIEEAFESPSFTAGWIILTDTEGARFELDFNGGNTDNSPLVNALP